MIHSYLVLLLQALEFHLAGIVAKISSPRDPMLLEPVTYDNGGVA